MWDVLDSTVVCRQLGLVSIGNKQKEILMAIKMYCMQVLKQQAKQLLVKVQEGYGWTMYSVQGVKQNY